MMPDETKGWHRGAGDAVDNTFAEEVPSLRASCRDGELEVGHLIVYGVRYIRPQLYPHNNKLVPSSSPTIVPS